MKNQEFRNVTKFLWFPKTIEGKTKWLVKSTWEEESHLVKTTNWFNPILGGPNYEWTDWKPSKWI